MRSFTPVVLFATLAARRCFAAAVCPSVWGDVAEDLKSSFVDGDGKCNDNARGAIRLSFHDCFPGSCDGSIILTDECTARIENSQLVNICSIVGDKANQFNVGVADLIQFAAAIGIASCPGGPKISVKVGRTDSFEADPTGQLISPNADAATIIRQFSERGFSIREFIALMATHSTAKDRSGNSLDTTVGEMDMRYYTETADGSISASLNSDKNLSNATETVGDWNAFAEDPVAWEQAFIPAMEKMAVIGNDQSQLVDCSEALRLVFP
ncbi:putative class II peroxidase [Durotheca rogersii]|uniref:putative class II peroxidase n=1 Tax=Durotheca rogersii TaxID=419775 RepID=UPI00221E5D00|nr:putative class II peroxidase [Durotheca rogersii]KAI5866735.1 putative class II peroxidase [Durotheca rogersii]